MKNTRYSFIDIARAFAIIFIVLGHTIVHSSNCTQLYKLLYSFHIALFFIISGYLVTKKENIEYINFIKKKFIRIVVPYLIWATIFLIPYMLFGKSVGDSIGVTSSFSIKIQIRNILYGNGNMMALKQNSALWFLPALFTIECLFYPIITKYSKGLKSDILVLLIFFIIGFSTSNHQQIILPWGLNTFLNIGIFFYSGYLLRKYDLLNKTQLFNKKKIMMLFIIGFLAFYFNKSTVTAIEYIYGNYILMILSGFCLSIIIIYISFIINKSDIMEYIGKNTMGILIFHKLIILVFQTKLGIISQILLDSNFFVELLLSIIITSISIFVSLLITKIVKKIFSVSLGEKQKEGV